MNKNELAKYHEIVVEIIKDDKLKNSDKQRLISMVYSKFYN
jgi:hypothetical protein